MEKVFIVINGPSCVGKSSVIGEIGKLSPEFFHLAYDRVKWYYVAYNSQTHKDRVFELLGVFANYATHKGLPLISEGGLYKDKNAHLIALAESAGYTVKQFNLTAPKEVLLDRFRNRIEETTFLKKKISNTNEERFWEIYEQVESNKNTDFLTYDTSKLTSEEIARDILSKI